MKTKTEIQVVLNPEEQSIIMKASNLIGKLFMLIDHANDIIKFRCWDVDHDYKEYDYEDLSLVASLLSDIYYAHEIGFNHIEKGQDDE